MKSKGNKIVVVLRVFFSSSTYIIWIINKFYQINHVSVLIFEKVFIVIVHGKVL